MAHPHILGVDACMNPPTSRHDITHSLLQRPVVRRATLESWWAMALVVGKSVCHTSSRRDTLALCCNKSLSRLVSHRWVETTCPTAWRKLLLMPPGVRMSADCRLCVLSPFLRALCYDITPLDSNPGLSCATSSSSSHPYNILSCASPLFQGSAEYWRLAVILSNGNDQPGGYVDGCTTTYRFSISGWSEGMPRAVRFTRASY